MWLAWDAAAWLALGLAVIVVATRSVDDSRVQVARTFGQETTIILALYALWQRAGTLSIMHTTRAKARGRTIWAWERAWHLPNERTMQRWVLPHPWLSQACNRYYAYVHVPALGLFLVWLFTRHRSQYPAVRTTLAVATGACLAVQLVPVAPPRMFPDLGFVDLAQRYHQSVYSSLGTGLADQLSAMPSVHIAWAALIGVAAWRISRSRWRWLAVAHLVATAVVVTVTANHWLADGIVAALLVAAAWAAQRVVGKAARRLLPGSAGNSQRRHTAERDIEEAAPAGGFDAERVESDGGLARSGAGVGQTGQLPHPCSEQAEHGLGELVRGGVDLGEGAVEHPAGGVEIP